MLRERNYCVCFAARHRSSPPTGDVSLCLPSAGCGLLLVERVEHLLRVSFRLDLGPAARDLAVRSNQERRPLDAHVLLAVVHLLDPRSVLLRDGMILVGEKREGKAELGLEARLAARAQDAQAPDLRVADAVFAVGIA